MRVLMILMSMLVAVVPASAGTKAGVTLPDSMTVGDKQLVLNGMGLREVTLLKVDVYVAGLYVERVTSNPTEIIAPDRTKVMMLRFKRDVGHDDITKAWRDGFKGNATVSLASLEPMIQRLNSWMPSFKKGDTLTFVYVPNSGVAVEINGARKGVINNTEFSRSLFSIWLGPNPPTDRVKRGLLGRHGEV